MFKRNLAVFSSLRFRLIGWYLVLLVLTLVFFSIYIFVQFRELEQAQQDTTLQAATERVRGLVDPGRPLDGRPGDPTRPGDNAGRAITPFSYFRRNLGADNVISDLNRSSIQVRLLDKDGKVSDTLGTAVGDMPQVQPTPQASFTTISTADKGQWRVYTLPLMMQGTVFGWLQVGQTIFLVDAQLGNLFIPVAIGALMILGLALLGGLFLANQALKPIDRVTRTAQSISLHDLGQRINYTGPADEIGRLAKTLDQMLERLERGFEQERRFTSDASHELRTPLTALKGRIEVTLSRVRSAEDYRQTLTELSLEVERLVRLTNSLLYLARLDQTKHQWEFETLDLKDLLESMVDSMESVAELKNIKLSGQLADDIAIQGNLDQLTRLFLNLLDNAIKYTPEGGQVTVRTEKIEKTKKVHVSISDSGAGIAPEHLPHLFKRFYRAESGRESTSGGAGLGLAIANEIARQHGGALHIESRVGQGTTMCVELPLASAVRELKEVKH